MKDSEQFARAASETLADLRQGLYAHFGSFTYDVLAKAFAALAPENLFSKTGMRAIEPETLADAMRESDANLDIARAHFAELVKAIDDALVGLYPEDEKQSHIHRFFLIKTLERHESMLGPETIQMLGAATQLKFANLSPTREKGRRTRSAYAELVRPRSVYLVRETKPVMGFRVFVDLVMGGMSGLCITRQHPATVRKTYGLERTPILWITATLGQYNVSPTDLGILSNRVYSFIDETRNSVVLLDGLEYLVFQNGFQAVLKALDYIGDAVAQHDTRLLMPVHPDALDRRELAMLERHWEVLSVPGLR